MPLTGLIAAPHTPFRPDGSLNPDAIDRQCEHLLRCGADGAFVCGTTGEGMSLTLAERRTVAERWVRAAAGRLPVVVHVGHPCQQDAAELAAHAAGVGATAIAALAPFHLKSGVVPTLTRYLAGVAAAAPGVPFYFYDIPALTGVTVPTARLMAAAADAVPTFAGVKFSNPDLLELQLCLHVEPRRLEVLFGVDEMLLAAVALGVRGAVGSTYNFAAPLYRRMISAFAAGDVRAARACQWRSLQLVRVLETYGGIASGKAVMSFLGVECGPARPVRGDDGGPWELDPDRRAALRQQLEQYGHFADDGFHPDPGD